MEIENNAYFWQKLDTLLLGSDVVINHKKNSSHPNYPSMIYPVDYGYLKDYFEENDEKISLFVGSETDGQINSVAICVDILKKDISVKLLVGCTAEEETKILEFLDQSDYQKAILVRRGSNIPDWAYSI